ncbi:2-dehydropantoate 2-reductase N-terminal domain-containing protein [Streptomyces sp. NBC_00347]|uniref:2-dehydropantoate 2-reductase N-terminal domain-containing protein n=1 Tax=unclassified Streptomyces TaxID=2593676 RepID=UPI00338EA9C6
MPHPTGDQRPRIAVFGAGSIGCYLGGHLAQHADVTLIGRPSVLDGLHEGVTLSGGGRPAVRVPRDRLTLTTEPDAVADNGPRCGTTWSTVGRRRSAISRARSSRWRNDTA